MRLCEPAVSAEVEIEAVPALRVAVPSDVAPSRKVTVPPVGVVGPVTLATVAVSVVDCPNTDGLTELVRVVVVFSTTTKVPVSVGVSLQPPEPVAFTVRVVEPGGVVAELVLMVRVDDVGLELEIVPGLKVAFAPVGRTLVTVSAALQAAPLPLKFPATE